MRKSVVKSLFEITFHEALLKVPVYFLLAGIVSRGICNNSKRGQGRGLVAGHAPSQTKAKFP